MPSSHALRDWVLLLLLAAMWGSAFMFIKLGVATVPPATLVAARLAGGALILYAFMRQQRLVLPPPGRRWLDYAVLGVVGNVLPFFLISWGQQFVDSALAGVLMAIMPLTTLVLAHFFVSGEHMTRARLLGFAVGFGGIVVLMGPAAVAGLAGTEVFAQLMVLGGAICYATNSVLSRRLVAADFLIASTGVLIVASFIAIPFALWLDRPWTLDPSASSTAAIAWLGAGPTALATLAYFALIASAGPTFMALVNYLAPIVALVCGVLLLGEAPGANAYGGLALILLGIALSRRRA
jgi:drug/metabolite transporter (DMT)-like permease